MGASIDRRNLIRLRLAAQRLTPATAAASAVDAARSVVGIQAQDVRAAGLSLRARVPGLERGEIDASGLIRSWTVRGTVHLIDPADRDWLAAIVGPRNRRYLGGLMEKRGNLGAVRTFLGDAIALLEAEPLTRAELLARLRERGHPELDQSSANVLMPWIESQGLIAGLADGRFRAANPPTEVDAEEALATLVRRYLAGYGPASAADMARWSGLPLGTCRRGFDAAGRIEAAGELRALPGGFEADAPVPAPAKLLGAFDTSLLGWEDRRPLLAAGHASRVSPGGGIIRAAVLAGDRAVAPWRLAGSGRRRRLECEWFGRRPARAALAAEAADVGSFLGVEITRA